MTSWELGKYFYYLFGVLFVGSAIIKPSIWQNYLWLKISIVSIIFILTEAFINPAYYGAKNFTDLLSASLLIQQLLLALVPAFFWYTILRFFFKPKKR